MKSTLTHMLLDQHFPLREPGDGACQTSLVLRETLTMAVENAETESEQRAVAAAAWLCPRLKRRTGYCYQLGGRCDRGCDYIREFRAYMNFVLNDNADAQDELAQQVEKTNARMMHTLQTDVIARIKAAQAVCDTPPGAWSEREK